MFSQSHQFKAPPSGAAQEEDESSGDPPLLYKQRGIIFGQLSFESCLLSLSVVGTQTQDKTKENRPTTLLYLCTNPQPQTL
jgi:hypothetical protein